ncbi:hypothetical protein PM082_023275 [Marasmius tenuissimus]|nr:hypothetical protein PM082_023275 [Marasmius tenuissimus]
MLHQYSTLPLERTNRGLRPRLFIHPNSDDIGGTLPSEDQRRALLPSPAHTDRLHPSSSLIRSSRTWIWTYGYKVSEREDLESWKPQTDDKGHWLATQNEALIVRDPRVLAALLWPSWKHGQRG